MQILNVIPMPGYRDATYVQTSEGDLLIGFEESLSEKPPFYVLSAREHAANSLRIPYNPTQRSFGFYHISPKGKPYKDVVLPTKTYWMRGLSIHTRPDQMTAEEIQYYQDIIDFLPTLAGLLYTPHKLSTRNKIIAEEQIAKAKTAKRKAEAKRKKWQAVLDEAKKVLDG